MKVELKVPHFHDLKSLEGIIGRVRVIESEVEDSTLKAKIEIEDSDRDRMKKLLQREYEPTESQLTKHTETVDELELPIEPVKDSIETYEDAVLYTGYMIENLTSGKSDARNRFSALLGSKHLSKYGPMKSCGATTTVAASILRTLGIETGFPRGLMLRKRDKAYRGEHTWNTLKIGNNWIEVDFAGKGVYEFPGKENIPLVYVKDPLEHVKDGLKFAKEDEDLADVFKVIED